MKITIVAPVTKSCTANWPTPIPPGFRNNFSKTPPGFQPYPYRRFPGPNRDLMRKLGAEADIAVFSGGWAPRRRPDRRSGLRTAEYSTVIHEPSLERAKTVYESLNFEFTETM